jgi:hypothetical protein
LLRSLIEEAHKKGFKPFQYGDYIRRKHGSFTVDRFLHDKSRGTSLPCNWCRKSMFKYGIRWEAFIVDDYGACVQVNELDAPPSKNTAGQKLFRKWV